MLQFKFDSFVGQTPVLPAIVTNKLSVYFPETIFP